MALNQEFWSAKVSDVLFADNSFLSVVPSFQENIINGKYVHVPVAGSMSDIISVDPSSFPITGATSRTDSDNLVTMHSFALKPIYLADPIETYEVNYNKAQSVLNQSLKHLTNSVADKLLVDLASGATVYTGTGAGRAALNATQTGNRSGITLKEIKSIAYKFDSQDVPADGRYLVLPSELAQDITTFSEFKDAYTLTEKVVVDGFIGKIYGFNVILRSKVLVTNSANTLLATATHTATSNAAGLAFSTYTVAKAYGSVEVFSKENDPNYYGNVISALQRAVAFNLYDTKLGVAIIAEKASA